MNERTFPRTLEHNDQTLELSLMGDGDVDLLVDFAKQLPRHDLLFLRRDIRESKAVLAWTREIAEDRCITVLAKAGDKLLGYGSMHKSELRWSEHVAELRIVVSEDARGMGLGSLLTQEVFAIALETGIEKMIARMTLDQKGAIATFEGLGFRPEALLRDHVKDLNGDRHDLIVMSLAVDAFHSTIEAYGVPALLDAD